MYKAPLATRYLKSLAFINNFKFSIGEGTQFRNTFRGRKVNLKPFSINHSDKVLSVSIQRATYQANFNTITLSKPGYLAFNFYNFDKNLMKSNSKNFDKLTYIINIRN